MALRTEAVRRSGTRWLSAAVKDVDRYGRLVARVLVGDRDLSVELVRAGLAWHCVEYSKDPVRRDDEISALAAHGIVGSPEPGPAVGISQHDSDDNAAVADA